MDFSPRVQKLIAEIRAVQLKAECSATQLAADVRQILLATTVDIEQRWQWLSPEDQVEALTDLITLVVIFNRGFAESATVADATANATGKALSEILGSEDQANLTVDLNPDDVVGMLDTLSRVMDYRPAFDDSFGMVDALEAFLLIVRQYADSVAPYDVPAKAADKFIEDLGGLYVETGYFADDYWQAGAPVVMDTFSGQVGKTLIDSASLADALSAVTAFVRALSDTAAPLDAAVMESQLGKADIAATTDATVLGFEALNTDTVAPIDAAALDFAAQVQDLVATAEDFARTVSFVRTATEAVTATDTQAKAFTASFSDIGGLYANLGYFADDYVAAGAGPAVYDTFSYTLA